MNMVVAFVYFDGRKTPSTTCPMLPNQNNHNSKIEITSIDIVQVHAKGIISYWMGSTFKIVIHCIRTFSEQSQAMFTRYWQDTILILGE